MLLPIQSKKKRKMKKKKIEVEIKERFEKLCKRFKMNPKTVLEQLQADFIGEEEEERMYEVILAQLYFSECIASSRKIDRGVVEELLENLRSYHSQLKKEESIPSHLSQISQSLMEENKYDKNYTKN